MSNQNAAFEDLEPDGFGALAGGGADQLDRVTTKIQPTGIVSTCSCGWCGQKNGVQCDWEETVMGSMGFPAPNWRVDQKSGTIYPYLGCTSCQREIKIGYTPAELKRYVISGVEQGFVNGGWVQNFSAQVKAAAQQGQGLARR